LKENITPRLFRVTAIETNDTYTGIYTSIEMAKSVEQNHWDDGGVVGTSIDYADESIDGIVIWKQYKKGK
jgi:hypothetical protein